MFFSSITRPVLVALMLGLLAFGMPTAQAQNIIAQTNGSTLTEKMVFAVYDCPRAFKFDHWCALNFDQGR